MEWHTLDANLKRDTVIEDFESFIWTERYNSWGDFTIVIVSTPEARRLLAPGTLLGMEESYRVMTIETVQEDLGEDGTRKLTVTGRSIEAWLDDRVAYPSLDDLTTNPKWHIADMTPASMAFYIFQQICESHILNANDVIPFYHLQPGPLPNGSLPLPSDTITMDFDMATVYADVSAICQAYNLGFRLYKDGDTGNIYFDIYTGFDRTSGQTDRTAVIFSPSLESVSQTSTLTSFAGFKNVAYVFAQHGTAVVYATGYGTSTPPIQRKVLLVDASDIETTAGAALTAALNLRGTQALAENRRVYALDGVITPDQPYRYGVDYNLGDMVEERSDDGFINDMLVTEQIFISDDQGERSYPTLMVSTFATAGSWDAELPTEFWDDVDPGLYWADE